MLKDEDKPNTMREAYNRIEMLQMELVREKEAVARMAPRVHDWCQNHGDLACVPYEGHAPGQCAPQATVDKYQRWLKEAETERGRLIDKMRKKAHAYSDLWKGYGWRR